jgi:ubiquinone/menaquinone biosynthesis C-methylase UbiE
MTTQTDLDRPDLDRPDFDRIAHPYKFLEYLTLGSSLQRCRTYFLCQLLQQRSALVLGDGDGRFLAELLTANATLQAEAVDTSRAMLDLLTARCAPHRHRIQTHHASALAFVPTQTYDLVVTNFFLDCLTQAELNRLVRNLTPHLEPGALWLVSDFRIPATPIRPLARILVRILYYAFRLLTGLRTTQLPDHSTPLAAAGCKRIAHHYSLAGILTTELWQRQS